MSTPAPITASPLPLTAPGRLLELSDVQTIALRPGGYPSARYVFLHVTDAEKGRNCLREVLESNSGRLRITDSRLRGNGRRPDVALNIGFTWRGLAALGVPWRSLASFPPEFRQGMRARAEWLSDVGESDPANWDAVWQPGAKDVHVWVGIHSKTSVHDTEVEAQRQTLSRLADHYDVEILHVDEAGILKIDGQSSNKEHFGYSDGFTREDIAGSGDVREVPIGGKPDGRGGWAPLAPGEVLLGHPNEDGEVGAMPVPVGLARNGTYLVYRKLEQKVYTFRKWLEQEGAAFPGGRERLAAKLVGRWQNGAPLAEYPDGPPDRYDAERAKEFRLLYGDDPEGALTPLGCHIRRANPRDALGYDGTLVNRHRVFRRGLPYGEWIPPGTETPAHDEGHGIIFMVVGASLERQFEFAWREWVNNGNDFRQGADPDPLVGYHPPPTAADPLGTRMAVQGHPADSKQKAVKPWLCARLPQFVATRGGEYFFVPSLTALRLICNGRVEQF